MLDKIVFLVNLRDVITQRWTPHTAEPWSDRWVLFFGLFWGAVSRYSFIHSSTALRPFVGPRPLFQFRNPIHSSSPITVAARPKAGYRLRPLVDAAKETPERHKTVSTERAQHTEIPLPRDKEPLRVGSTRAKFCRARQHGIDFATESNEHCLARQPRAIDTRLKAWTFFSRSNTGIVVSNSTQGMDVCIVCVYSVCR
jgi:hypothetical protein